MRIRRLRILGVALGLSAFAALAGMALYLLPPEVGAPVNRIADFVVVNDAMRWVGAHLPARSAFPDRDDENVHLRLIAIDEASMNAPNDPQHPGLGQFPWPRRLYGELLTRLHAAGATIATFDVDFFEPAPDPSNDAAFAAGMRRQPTVLPFAITTTTSGVPFVEGPPPLLARAARALGSSTIDTPGGLVLGQELVITARDAQQHVVATYPSLAAQTVQAWTGQPITAIDGGHARFGSRTIPLDGEGKLLMLPFLSQETVDLGGGAGGPASRAGTTIETVSFFQAVSFVDALKFDPATMRAFAQGNVVVIGSTAQALGDFINTPYGRFPGVFANMRMMDQLMRGHLITRVPEWLDLALIALIPLLVGFAVTQLPPARGMITGIAIVIVYSAAAIALYGYTLHWMNLIHVDGATLMAALLVASYRSFTEGTDKRVIREMFGKHVSPALVEHMLAADDPLKALDLSGKRTDVTIFYSDIRGFTAMSEKMTPEEIYGALNEYFEAMCRIVFAYGGYVDKFIGDCLMAVFSAPTPRPDDAYLAVRCAWEQQQKIASMMESWAAQGRPVFTVGMGLNSGDVVMGNLGSADRLNYTVIGDNVNTASRLYNVAKGGQIIISESTYNQVKDRFIVNELTPVFVKGKTLALRNFEVVGLLEPGAPNPSTLLDPHALPAAVVADAH